MWLFKPESVIQAEDFRGGEKIFRQQNGGSQVHPRSDRSANICKKVSFLVTSEKKYGDKRFRRITWSWASGNKILYLH